MRQPEQWIEYKPNYNRDSDFKSSYDTNTHVKFHPLTHYLYRTVMGP